MPETVRWTRDGGESGASRTLALLPSLGTSHRLWDGVVARLRRADPTLAVLRLDVPGHGAAPPASGFTIESLARDALDGLQGTPGPVVLAGVSMGGAIALEMARLDPTLVAGFAMFTSAVRFGTARGWADLAKAVRTGGTVSLIPDSRPGWFDETTESAPAEAIALLRSLRDVDDAGYLACCDALAAYDARGTLADIAVPALIVAATADAATPAGPMAEIAAQLPHAQYREMPGAHLAVAQYPDAAAALLQQFLLETERPAP
jgi:3-oxoadipate enol-lactonase / 4-carboxymuconolactone decarboxylase